MPRLLLSTEGLRKSFGGLLAVDSVSVGLEAESITGLIGPNGSGKSTLFNCVTGLLAPDAGRVVYDGRPVTGLPPHRIMRLGLGRTFQLCRLFGGMTVVENLLAALPGTAIKANLRRAREVLEFLDLAPLANEDAAGLSYGQQKLVEFGRLLVLEPRCFLLDEPFAGVNPTLAKRLVAQIRELRARGATFLIVDHSMALLLDLVDRVLVMDGGALIADGTPDVIQRDHRVQGAYLGRRRSG